MFTRTAHLARRRGGRHAGHILLYSSPLLLTYGICHSKTLHSESLKDKVWPSSSTYSPGKLRTGDLLKSKENESSNVSTSKEEELPKQSFFGDFDDAAWATFSSRFAQAGQALSSLEWSRVGDQIANFIMPEWCQSIPQYVRKLQAELEARPGSLVEEIILESNDPSINPEITRVASVRISKELCDDELAFRTARRKYTTKALARYLDIPESDINPEDVPVIAMCGSGGGLRALVAGASSYRCAQQAGLFDCVTYTAGVSGSCWLQALYHSSITQCDFGKMLRHLKKRLGVHIAFPPPALNMLATAPTNKFLLSGLLEKAKADPKADFGLVDIYGLLLAARLLVPRGELEIEATDLKLSNQRQGTDSGRHPLPIYCAVRHEILPEHKDKNSADTKPPVDPGQQRPDERTESWFQWFEWTPYEFWCEELNAGIPTWSLGRTFDGGRSVTRESGSSLPEMRVPQLLGIWGSAFCATLSHYYKEIRPVVKGLTGFGGIDDLIAERDSDLVKVHPIDPATIPNFVKGLGSELPTNVTRSVVEQDHLQLMDAGMSNNLPIYPLLRPGRNVDIVVAFDASADIKQENWLALADGYVKQRGIAGWPVGAGWPREDESKEQITRELDAAQAESPEEARRRLKDAKDADAMQHSPAQVATSSATPEPTTRIAAKDLGHCTVWVGAVEQYEASQPEQAADQDEQRSTSGRSNEIPRSTRIDSDSPESTWDFVAERSDPGIAVVYFPLIPNEEGAPGIDPEHDAFMSTWNFVYKPEDIDSVERLARANWEAGSEQTRRCVRAVYERKKRIRLEKEAVERESRFRETLHRD